MLKQLWKKNKTKNGLPNTFLAEYETIVKQQRFTSTSFRVSEDLFHPCLDDATKETGFDRHYVYHPAWAMRIVTQLDPALHIDISSTLHFCSMLSAVIPTAFYDYRPADLVLDNLTSSFADLTNLPFTDSSVSSLSCMQTVEHVGLGRYGEVLDYDGDRKAIAEFKRVLTPGGSLLFVVPLGGESVICFNAHRIYDKDHVLSLFSDMELMDFSLIPEDGKDGGLVADPPESLLHKQFYACGCFWFKKRELAI
ncbi:DUF268 domain-containing protein [Parapedobacter tibetensis]|uniref:DUF268 domain-containing protein n=1 Tax=Parapedobacter tibetensis TaxID=2972951 RepID=UPI00214D9554|nr:DUF268 domain-containing protein [Parapedobacter tibetensis]